ncbi:hypothetical protein BJ138DRAFT_373116 [Hygrophoropsis aurantiaca]|uniref:Uncharacterized protein n=1 Tax=Hygrophoropsis aurantiaca TaxID=72124 RepID=A0ACB8A5H0_9AGAM|nr:hypothetical protein BJ138DRAFT_373116 [Hygrophoropsis aurantiaca]
MTFLRATVNEDLMKILVTFSQKSILYWVETLSLLGAMDVVITMLRDAISWLKLFPTFPDDTLTLFKDTYRLALMFFDPISQSSLHVYHSALPLTPTNTLLRKYFQAELTGKFVVMDGLHPDWDGCVRAIDVGDLVHSVAFSPTDSVIASASAKHGAQLWNTTTGANIVSLGPPQKPSAPICFSPSGARMALAFESGLVAVWDASTAQPLINNKESHREPVTSVNFSPNNTTLASASRDKSIQLWEVETGETLHRLQHEDPVLCQAFSVNGRMIVSGCQGGLCSTWDVETGQLLRKLRGHNESVNSVAISGDGLFIASGSDDKAVRVWDSKTGVCVRTYAKGHKKGITDVRFTPDNTRVVSVCPKYVGSWLLSSRKSFDVLWSANDYIKKATSSLPMWYTKAFKLIPSRLAGYFHDVDMPEESLHLTVGFSSDSSSVAFSLQKAIIYSTSLARSIHNNPPSFNSSSADNTALAVSSDGSQVASGNAQGSIELWDPSLALKNWTEYSDYYQMKIQFIRSSPDGNRHISARLADLFLLGPRAEVIKKLSGFETGDTGCLYSADSSKYACWGDVVLNSNDDATALRVYKCSTGDRIFRVVVGKIQQVAVSTDGTLVGCAHDKGVLEVWDVSSGHSLHKFPCEAVWCIYFAPDNSKIAFGTPNGKVHLWDLRTGDSLAVIEHGADKITCIAFSPDSNHLAYGYGDGSLHVWFPLPTGLRHTVIPGSKESADPLAHILFSSDGTTINCRTFEGTFYTVKVPAELFETNSKSDDESAPSSSSGSVQCDICKLTVEESPSSTDCPNNSIAPNPHVEFTSDKTNVRDVMFRSDYEVRHDGWVYDGDRRILWLPPPFRPSAPYALKAYNDKLTIMTNASGGLFIDLAPMDYIYRKHDLAP